MNKPVRITLTVIFPCAQPIPKGLAGELHHPDQKSCCPVAQCSLWTKRTVTIPTEPSSSIPKIQVLSFSNCPITSLLANQHRT